METPILTIQQKKYTGDSTVISLRLPKDMLKDIDEVASTSGRTRNDILMTCLEFSLSHLTVSGQDEPNA
jgi:metal-responsive CopG/Arc/MetJ family transcriptional regulator